VLLIAIVFCERKRKLMLVKMLWLKMLKMRRRRRRKKRERIQLFCAVFGLGRSGPVWGRFPYQPKAKAIPAQPSPLGLDLIPAQRGWYIR
jgi:hypothetical protein